MKQPAASGFVSAATVFAAQEEPVAPAMETLPLSVDDPSTPPTATPNTQTLSATTAFSFRLEIVGLRHHDADAATDLTEGSCTRRC